MKIFFYINTISSGGAERVLTNLATEMSTRGRKEILFPRVVRGYVAIAYALHPATRYEILRFALF